MLFVNYILLLSWLLDEMISIKVFSLLLGSYLLTGISAYLVNEFYDREVDAKAGKNNIANDVKSNVLAMIVFSGFSISFFMLYLVSFKASLLLIGQVVALLMYSHPLIRLKTKPTLGIVVDATYAYVIPLLILFAVFEVEVLSPNYLSFLLFNIFIGLRDIVLHQEQDRLNDLKSGIDSFVIKYHTDTNSVLALFEVGASLSVGCFFILSSLKIEHSYALALAVSVYGLFALLHWIKIQKAIRNNVLMQFYIVVSTVVIGWRLWQEEHFWMIVFLAHPYLNQFITLIFQLLNQLKILLSIVVNHSLYYGVKIFGRDLKKRPLFKKNE